MSTTGVLPLAEVDCRLSILQHNLTALRLAAEEVALTAPDPLPFVSLAQAFADEAEVLALSQAGSPDDRYAALDHTLSNIATIREEAEAVVVRELDESVKGTLRSW